MANKNFQKKTSQDNTFGKYEEGVGGGDSPQPRNYSQRAPGVNSEHRRENNDTMQPRTDDGKFTYKSVNGKSINPKYGPSRGTTVNPLLTGGKNGVQIDEVKRQFQEQQGEYWDKYKDKWYRKGDEMIAGNVKDGWKTKVAAEDIWEVYKTYNESTGEFGGGDVYYEHELGNGGTRVGKGKNKTTAESEVFDETKKGRPSNDAKKAASQAEKTGVNQAVIDSKTGGFRNPNNKTQKTKVPSAGNNNTQSPVIPTTPTSDSPTNTVDVGSENDGSNGLLHSKDQLERVRNLIRENGHDDSLYTDEQIDALYNTFIDDDDEIETKTEELTIPTKSKNNKNNNKSDSKIIKKIKDMGFSE